MKKISIIALSINKDYLARLTAAEDSGNTKLVENLQRYYEGAKPEQFIVEGPSATKDGDMTCIVNREKGFARLDAVLKPVTKEEFISACSFITNYTKVEDSKINPGTLTVPKYVRLSWLTDKPLVIVSEDGMNDEINDPLFHKFDITDFSFAKGTGLVSQVLTIKDKGLEADLVIPCYSVENFNIMTGNETADKSAVSLLYDAPLLVSECNDSIEGVMLKGLSFKITPPEGTDASTEVTALDPKLFNISIMNNSGPSLTVVGVRAVGGMTNCFDVGVTIGTLADNTIKSMECTLSVYHPDLNDGEIANIVVPANIVFDPNRFTVKAEATDTSTTKLTISDSYGLSVPATDFKMVFNGKTCSIFDELTVTSVDANTTEITIDTLYYNKTNPLTIIMGSREIGVPKESEVEEIEIRTLSK